MKLEVGSLYICDRIAAPNPWKDKLCLYLGEDVMEVKLPISTNGGSHRIEKVVHHKFLREGKIVKASVTFVKYFNKVS
tara:strand:- start:189 stop:422 length:234 start_codon:yes stop_codon:yes gene_type:complete